MTLEIVIGIWAALLVTICAVGWFARSGEHRREAVEAERRALRRELMARGEWLPGRHGEP